MNNETQHTNVVEMSKAEKRKAYRKAYHEANKERLSTNARAYREANKEKLRAHREANKEKYKAYLKVYREVNKEKLRAYESIDEVRARRKAYYKTDIIKEKRRAYESTDEVRAKRQAYIQSNKKKVYACIKACAKARKETDPLFKFTCSLRSHSCRAFKRIGVNKPTKTEMLIGCSWQEAKEHIEALFQPGMTWSNHGRGEHCWHIDHRVPIASATTIEEAIALNHISNLQPLWEKDNLTKGAKYID
jgi:hypothetical protein